MYAPQRPGPGFNGIWQLFPCTACPCPVSPARYGSPAGGEWSDTGRTFGPRAGTGRDLEILAFAPRCEPPRARAPGAQMIRMSSGSWREREKLAMLQVENATVELEAP
eukprot:gene22125-biopygen8720